MILCCLVTHYLSLYDYDWYCSLIGDLKYISYPLICEDGISTMGTIDTEKYEPTEKIISLFNVVVCVVRDSALAKLKLRESHLQHVASMSSSHENVGADPIITALGLHNSFKEITPNTLKRAVKVCLTTQKLQFHLIANIIMLLIRTSRWHYCLRKGDKDM